MKLKITAIAAIVFLVHCTTVPITGRKQLKLLPSSQLNTMSFSQYAEVKKQVKLLPDSDPRTQLVKSVGDKLAIAANKYMEKNGLKSQLKEFEWEFNLADDETVNAWAMPGGKVMFYTGILPICDGEEGIATVMGHEIAHAIARHGNERMSQQMAIQGFGTGLSVMLQEKPEMTQNLFMTAFGAGSQLGILKYSRNHESEADKMGLVFMTMAGYNPASAADFWTRMAGNKGGQAPPEFMSTHPSDERRIKDINDFIPTAKELAAKNK
tara:strand:- start:4975 stop:5775 length:801 start_codon:yes stop_codon:yes gene_type:complete